MKEFKARTSATDQPQASFPILKGAYLPYFLANCSEFVYEDGAQVREIFGNSPDWTPTFISDPITNTQCFLAQSTSTNEVIISFRGTQETADFFNDANFFLTPWWKGSVHTGFIDA